MRSSRSTYLLTLLFTFALFGIASAAPSGSQRSAHAHAELLLNTDGLTPGQQGIAAIVATIDDGYHAQSSQPLDDALIPLAAELTADDRLEIYDPLYPPGDLLDFPALGGKLSVYSKRVIVFVPFVVKSDAKIGDITFKASIGLQLCNDETCDAPTDLPATLQTAVASTGTATKAINSGVFGEFDSNRWLNKHPVTKDASTSQPALPSNAEIGWVPFSDDSLATARKTGKPVIIDFTAAWCVNCHVVERRVYGDQVTLDELRNRGATLMKADLTQDGAPGSDLLARLNPSRSIPFTAVYFPGNDVPAGLTGIYSSADLLATLNDAGKTATSTTTIFGYELAAAPLAMKVAVAIAVGLLLNAVPCVLPVLPLKAMSFYEDAGHDRTRSMINGAAFSLGIIATFGGLALFVITQDALWGKFISHPITAAALAIVLLVAAAQAFGLFEIVLPRALTNLEIANENYAAGDSALDHAAAGRLSPRKLAANFFSGILIAVLSTPCTIGVFAAVIAVAITAGATVGSLILMFVGVGMALPWFALSAFPEVTRKFPRTGPWPSVVKQMTAFLLLATAIFFAAPLTPASFRASALWWLIFACVAAAAVFLIARTIQIAPRARPIVIASCVSALLVVGGLAMTFALTA